MKLVCAIVNPFSLDQVLESLVRIGIRSLTVTDTRDYGQKGHTEIFRGAEFTAKFRLMNRIEVAVAAHQVEGVVKAILSAAKTDRPGGGTIFVTQLDCVLSIQTGLAYDTVPPLAA